MLNFLQLFFGRNNRRGNHKRISMTIIFVVLNGTKELAGSACTVFFVQPICQRIPMLTIRFRPAAQPHARAVLVGALRAIQ